ncbi:MAG: hypothetical protein CME59_09325 [Halioglobus sp.]|nr:hypothetical protein [Halioglobus sp.]|tara:strand:- start:459 stop:1277 length:819 start_codon:yes stop_codon:yes gene_type:complete
MGTRLLSRVLAPLALVAALAAGTALAQNEVGAAAGQPLPWDKRAHGMLLDMAQHLEKLQNFQVSIRAGYDAMQADGQLLEFLERREVRVARPSLLRVDEAGADGRPTSLIFDGEQITVYDGTHNVFALAPQPGGIDDAMVYLLRDLQMRLPLGMMFTTYFSQELQRRLLSVAYVEQSYAFAQPTHHIAGRTGWLDFQVWLPVAGEPLPRRIVLTYRGAPGHPQHWMDFDAWHTDSSHDTTAFDFEPPAEATQILFAVQVPPEHASGQAGEAP